MLNIECRMLNCGIYLLGGSAPLREKEFSHKKAQKTQKRKERKGRGKCFQLRITRIYTNGRGGEVNFAQKQTKGTKVRVEGASRRFLREREFSRKKAQKAQDGGWETCPAVAGWQMGLGFGISDLGFSQLILIDLDDAVAVLDGGEAMGDDKDGELAVEGLEGVDEGLFGVVVEGGGGLVEDEDFGAVSPCLTNSRRFLGPRETR